MVCQQKWLQMGFKTMLTPGLERRIALDHSAIAAMCLIQAR